MKLISRLKNSCAGRLQGSRSNRGYLASYGRDIGSDLVSLLGEIEKSGAVSRIRLSSLDPADTTEELISFVSDSEIVCPSFHVALLEKIEESGTVRRIRLSSLDPADTTEELINFVSESEIVCPSFHVALQSGDRDVLRKMRRRYSPEQFLECTDTIRSVLPEASIGTDIMVGFPGETQEQFENSRDVAAASELTYFHVFPYSIRKMTPAANMKDQVSPQVKKERAAELRALGKTKKENFYRTFIGKTLDAIVESKSNCTTENYINAKLIEGNIRSGTEIKIEIKSVRNEVAHAIAV